MNRIGDNLLSFQSNEAIVESFADHQVEYILVGGLAVSWYCNERQAADMDLMVRPTRENSLRIRDALDALSLTVPELGFTALGQQAQLKNYYNADILTPPIGGPSYDEISDGSVDVKLFNLPVRVPSVAMLIRLKEKAAEAESRNRDAVQKHRNDITLLRGIAQS